MTIMKAETVMHGLNLELYCYIIVEIYSSGKLTK